MNSVADFLLARITEDEGEAQHRDAVQFGVEQRRLAPAAKADAFTPTRVLAECAAKRRIIAFVAEHHEWDGPYLLRMLALPYADHPDFREEWRA